MKSSFQKTAIISCICFFSSISVFAQWYDSKEMEIGKNENPNNYIGAVLPTDPSYYFKTAEGKDSVILESYTIYGEKTKRVFTNRGGSVMAGTQVPSFTGILKDGAMQSGELFYNDNLYSSGYHYKGEFKNNRAEGIGIFTITSTFTFVSKKQCKALFSNGYLTGKGNVKADFDSAGKAQLYYSGDLRLANYMFLLMDGYGSFFRTGNVQPSKQLVHGVGAANSYYEGQVTESACTGFGIYNFFDYNTKKTSYLRVGLVAADLVTKSFSTLPINLESNTVEKLNGNNKGIYELLPELNQVRSSYFIHNGKRYAGLTLNNKPYGIGTTEDADGFKEIGFWKNGEKISTHQLLSYTLPDSAVLKPYTVVNKITSQTTAYNSKKNKYITEEKSWVADVTYYGKINSQGALEGWGWRKGGLNPVVGHFLSVTPLSGKKTDEPEAKLIFDTAYAVKYGDGRGTNYGSEVEATRFYTGAVHKYHPVPLLPGWWILPIGTRDNNMIALTEYRDKRLFHVQSWKELEASTILANKKLKAEQEKAFNALFTKINNPSSDDIANCFGNFYIDRYGSGLYRVTEVDQYRKTFQVALYQNFSTNKIYISLTAAELLSSGNYRKVQKYVTCRFCGGKGTYTNSYSYTADYEYTLGAKITTTSSKTEVCGCGCGLEPATFGAKIDW